MIRWFQRRRRTLTPDDIRFLCLWCLGREPGSEENGIALPGDTVFSIAKRLFLTNEFRASVLGALDEGLSLPHEWLQADARKQVCEGLEGRFDASGIDPGMTWPALLAATLKGERAGRAFKAAHGERALEETIERLQRHGGEKQTALARIETVSGLTIRGWAVNRDDPKRVPTLDFFLNGSFAGSTEPDRMRRDLQEQFGGDGRFGFEKTLTLPIRLEGAPRLTLSLRDRRDGRALVPPIDLKRDDLSAIGHIQRIAASLEASKTDSGQSAEWLGHLEGALPHLRQYRRFPLANYDLYAVLYRPLLNAAGDKAQIATIPVELPVDWTDLPDVARDLWCDWIMPVHGEDTFEPGALAHLAAIADRNPGALILYPDHDHLDRDGRFHDPRLFAAFDHDLLLSRNDSGRAILIRREFLVAERDITSAQDLMLRAFEAGGSAALAPAPGVAWHLGTPPASEADAGAVSAHLARLGLDATVHRHADAFGGTIEGCLSIDWKPDPALPKLAVIIPTRNGLDLIQPCVESLKATLAYPERTEIIVVDNGSDDPATIAWMQEAAATGTITLRRDDRPFNWSALNNAAAKATDAGYLLFLNNDTLALESGWDATLRGYLARADVGAIGARLLYEDGTIQHAGVIFHTVVDGAQEGIGDTCDDGLYLDRTRRPHRTMAVFGAFLACRRDIFDRLEGFDETALTIGYSDYEFCFKAAAAGLATLYVPSLTFSHFESKSRGYDAQDRAKSAREESEREHIRAVWGNSFTGDPWYPSLFARQGKAFQALEAPIDPRD